MLEQGVLEEALARTRTALRAPTTPCHFRQYYSRSGNFAGVTFLDVGPFDAHAVTQGDLLALSARGFRGTCRVPALPGCGRSTRRLEPMFGSRS